MDKLLLRLFGIDLSAIQTGDLDKIGDAIEQVAKLAGKPEEGKVINSFLDHLKAKNPDEALGDIIQMLVIVRGYLHKQTLVGADFQTEVQKQFDPATVIAIFSLAKWLIERWQKNHPKV